MGYFKQQQIAEQEDVDRIIAWYSAQRDRITDEHMNWLLDDDERLWREIMLWEFKTTVPPKSARGHVALSYNRDHIRRERNEVRKVRRESAWMIAGLLVLTAGAVTLLIWIGGLV